MNQKKFAQFSEAYRLSLQAAVTKHPDEYFTQGATPEHYATVVSKRMMGNIESGKALENNYAGHGFKGACKAVGINPTRKAIFAFLEIT